MIGTICNLCVRYGPRGIDRPLSGKGQKLSSTQIAQEIGCSKTTVKEYLKRYGIRKNTLCGKTRHNLALGEKLQRGRAIPHRAELRTVETVVEMHTKQGLCASKIASILDTMKIPTKKQGKRWEHSVVIAILKREGCYQSTKRPQISSTNKEKRK